MLKEGLILQPLKTTSASAAFLFKVVLGCSAHIRYFMPLQLTFIIVYLFPFGNFAHMCKQAVKTVRTVLLQNASHGKENLEWIEFKVW